MFPPAWCDKERKSRQFLIFLCIATGSCSHVCFNFIGFSQTCRYLTLMYVCQTRSVHESILFDFFLPRSLCPPAKIHEGLICFSLG